MKLITWNIQWGRGIDGRVDLGRIVRTARAWADFDVLCVQEVADRFAGLPGNDDTDQFAALSALLPGYERVDGFGIDVRGEDGGRRRFGNAIFSRYPVLSARRHALPWPPEPGRKTMSRVAVECTVQAPWGPLRLTTTHLEYYSDRQRRAQVARLREIHDEACQRSAASGPVSDHESNVTFSATPQTPDAIVAGDFNLPPHDPAWREIQAPFPSGTPALLDAWRLVHGERPHPPTFCLYERGYGEAPYCCDFAFVSEGLAPRVRGIASDSGTRASDHQPLLLEIADR